MHSVCWSFNTKMIPSHRLGFSVQRSIDGFWVGKDSKNNLRFFADMAINIVQVG